MIDENLLVKAMTYDYPPVIPVHASFLPRVLKHHGDGFKELLAKYPHFFYNAEEVLTGEDNYETRLSDYHRVGTFADEWGCVWSNIDEGIIGLVTEHPLPNREDILTLTIPPDRDGKLPHGFMYLRLFDLRGFHEAMIDFAEECDELQILIDKVLEYNCYQIEAVLKDYTGPVVYLGDDLGMQDRLAIGPDKWRKYMKPAFQKMFQMIRDAGKLVYMHTDGMIWEIMPDLYEAGAHMINPQYRSNGLDNLVRTCKGKIPINLDLDRQMFSLATPEQLREHVRECVEAFYLPSGGLGLRIELGYDVPLENMEALLSAAETYRHYKG